MMLYPETYNVKKSNKLINSLVAVSIFVCLLCKFINVKTYPDFDWALIVILGVMYAWFTVIYSIRKHTNISAYVLLQVLLLIPFVLFLDSIIGFSGWSFSLAIPIIMIVANTIMFVLTIVARKRYLRYGLCHMIIFLVSLAQMIPFFIHLTNSWILMVISSSFGLGAFIMTAIMCHRALIEAAHKTFHI